MIIYLHPDNPEIRKLKMISEDLKKGAVYIFPTDTVYSIIADSHSREGVEKLYTLKNLDKHKPLSILCPDISTVTDYVEYIPDEAYKLMKRVTPGPFTFLFKANKSVLKISITNHKKKQIGIRIPDNKYILELLKVHEGTLTCTSVFSDDEYITDAETLNDIYGSRVAGIIEGGILEVITSTILDFSEDEMKIVREGKGIELL